MKLQHLSDDALVGLYQQGNYQAFEVLFYRYKEKVYHYFYLSTKNEEVTLDLFQDIFFKVIEKLQKGLYKENGKFSHWLMKIAHNALMDYYRSKAIHTTINTFNNNDDEEEDIFALLPDHSHQTDDKLISKENIEMVKKLITLLSPEQQEIIKLRIYEELSFKEIAEKLNISINTALGRMRYAILNLRKLAEKNKLLIN